MIDWGFRETGEMKSDALFEYEIHVSVLFTYYKGIKTIHYKGWVCHIPILPM